MKYMLFLYEDEDWFHGLPEPDQRRHVGDHMAYSSALSNAGKMLGGNPLDHSKAAKRIRVRGGVAIEDGPFTDSKEQLGGYYLIDADNLDEALDWAARCPSAATGVVEVRPVWTIGA